MSDDWLDIGGLGDIPLRGARTIPIAGAQNVAVFRTGDDQVFALVDRCPHKQGPLSQGIVHGHAVACPLHNWQISLVSGEALGGDKGCTPTIPVKIDGGRVLISTTAMRATALAA